MTGMVISNAVKLEERRDERSDQLSDAEVPLQGELVGVADQIADFTVCAHRTGRRWH